MGRLIGVTGEEGREPGPCDGDAGDSWEGGEGKGV